MQGLFKCLCSVCVMHEDKLREILALSHEHVRSYPSEPDQGLFLDPFLRKIQGLCNSLHKAEQTDFIGVRNVKSTGLDANL